MQGTHLTGLQGTNPLGFLAALGVQVLFETEEHQPLLWWTDDVVPHAVVDGDYDVERIVGQALTVFPRWLRSYALNPGTGTKADDDAKFSPAELTAYLAKCEQKASAEPANRLASALVAEGSYANNGKAKPSDLYLSAGRVTFLSDARKILGGVTRTQLANGLLGPWRYNSELPTLRWNAAHDPNWALAATKPGVGDGKQGTCPGPEVLALLGFSLIPVFGSHGKTHGRTLTQGCSGSWHQGGIFTWPLWIRPSGNRTVRSLLAHVTRQEPWVTQRAKWYRAWGVSHIVESEIRRSKTASGLGNMAPATIVTDIGIDG